MGGGAMKKRMKKGGLTGGQTKLDKNKDGKISGADFRMMKRGGGRIKAAAGTHVTKSGKTAKKGLWYNINQKKKRIAAGSGEKMRTPGSKGAPTAKAIKKSQA